MDIDQLRQFLRVAKHGNITHASEELGVSQPALSRSIQRLEEEFGQPLLERQTRCIALTDAGRLLESRARQILQIVDDTKTQIAPTTGRAAACGSRRSRPSRRTSCPTSCGGSMPSSPRRASPCRRTPPTS